ncbi:MAG: hypothetical protein H7177_06345 [Rhizobacter sp.]|nr:hypothetical protein [Bacteriovorax sp.]
MKSTKIIILSLILLFTFKAHAILLVEPHLGYVLVGTGQSDGTPATMIKHNGAQYGLKLGANYMNAMAGLDFNHSSFEQLTSGYRNDFGRNEFGLFVGYNFPGIVRTWLTYFFKNTQTANSGSTLIATGSEYEGHTIELGFGYNGFHPLVSVNFLYRIISQDKLISGSTTTTLSGSNEIGSNEVVLSVSCPLNLF